MRPLKVRGHEHRVTSAKEAECSHMLEWMKLKDNKSKETQLARVVQGRKKNKTTNRWAKLQKSQKPKEPQSLQSKCSPNKQSTIRNR